jgi:hypothetical protein
MATSPIVLKSLPGIKRDGTRYEGDYYVDGQWVRWQRGLPRKVGGYTVVNRYLTEVSRGVKTFTQNGLTYFHSGSADFVQRFTLDASGNSSLMSDRTPTTYQVSDNNLWQFDVIYDSQSIPAANMIVAQVAPNANCLCNTDGGQLFIGSMTGTDALTEVTTFPAGVSVTGGVVALHPYLMYFGNDGVIGWSVAGSPTDLTGLGSGSARVAGQKIVRGIALRGGPGNAPSGIFWSADAVIRGSFVGGQEVFQFDTISPYSSILSAASVIEYDGQYFWLGTDRMLMFNGVVREIPNNLNINYFYDGLNREAAQRVWAFKVPRYGEIWWCYPRGTATECTHAIIYNVRENTWYDTELPNGGRTAGEWSPLYAAPLLCGLETSSFVPNNRVTENGGLRVTQNGDQRIVVPQEGYKVWQHEHDVNEIDGQFITAVPSYFETADMSMLVPSGGSKNRWIRVEALEPDFVQSENMSVQMTGRANAKALEVLGPIKTIFAQPSTPYEQLVYFKEARRELRFKFTSNTINGDYQMGQIIAHIGEADGDMLGGIAGGST